MSLENIPENASNKEVEQNSDVAKSQELLDTNEQNFYEFNDMSLSQLHDRMLEILADENRLQKNKEVEAIKAAFYKNLAKEKEKYTTEEISDLENSLDDLSAEKTAEKVEEKSKTEKSEENNFIEEKFSGKKIEDSLKFEFEAILKPINELEQAFKSVLAKYKRERADHNKAIEQEREENLKQKEQLIEELKKLIDNTEDTHHSFAEFRALQDRWRSIGRVPETKFRHLNETYQYNVERFYDKVQIDKEARDADFKRNLQLKEEFCLMAEKLLLEQHILEAFKQLQKLHDQWKECGPVAKEYRESIWKRFQEATSAINKKYQAFFEEQKEKQIENLKAKEALCERLEALIADEMKTSNDWNKISKEIEELQKEWRTIGYATKKENQKIYDRFRASCDKFFEQKRNYYNEFKESMNGNMKKKLEIIEKAEALKDSQEWQKTTNALIELQRQWKEIGAVPRKKSEPLWKRFRAACDAFFEEREKQQEPRNDFYANLKAKKALLEKLKASQADANDKAAAEEFVKEWNNIGFVPFKEKDKLQAEFTALMNEKFNNPSLRVSRKDAKNSRAKQISPREKLIRQYNNLQQEIANYENNIACFALGTSSALLDQISAKIEKSKIELEELAGKIRDLDNNEEK